MFKKKDIEEYKKRLADSNNLRLQEAIDNIEKRIIEQIEDRMRKIALEEIERAKLIP